MHTIINGIRKSSGNYIMFLAKKYCTTEYIFESCYLKKTYRSKGKVSTTGDIALIKAIIHIKNKNPEIDTQLDLTL